MSDHERRASRYERPKPTPRLRQTTSLHHVLVPQVPNGELTSTQLRSLGEIIKPYGEAGCGDITTRANIQLRGIKLDDASDAIKKIEAMGLTTFMSGMDNVRNLTGSPIAGLDPHELVDVRETLVDMQVRGCVTTATPRLPPRVHL